ncbi:MAG: glycoside hydrolase family 3 N-terminal domain-containing protein [Bacteroidia bacterium]
MKVFRLIFVLILVSVFSLHAGSSENLPIYAYKYVHKDMGESHWVDSVMQTMSIEQKLGQLMVVSVMAKDDGTQDGMVLNNIRQYGIGGITFMKGEPLQQISMVNRYQGASKIPLMISSDAEWGMNMRMPSVIKFPRQMTLGAIQDDSLIYQFGAIVAKQCKRVGVQWNFAPVVDINSNASNPVIGDRSFGENKFQVARKGILYSKGMTDNQVLACAKHFPGHGDTHADSHTELPLISHSKARLDTLELFPFKKMADAGVPAIMVAHLSIPSLDATANLPASLSPKIVQKMLREEMGYNGLIVTDALNMGAVTKYFPSGKAELAAFKAGNDVLLFAQDVPAAVNALKAALDKGEITESQVNERVARILTAKYRLGLTKAPYVSSYNVLSDLNSVEAKLLKKKLYEAAVTLAKNKNHVIPLQSLENQDIAYIQVGGKQNSTFARTLQKYVGMKTIYLKSGFNSTDLQNVLAQVKYNNTVILGIFDVSKKASENFGITTNISNLPKKLAEAGKTTILSLFGSPYALKNFGSETATLVGYEEEEEAQQAVAAAIFGGLAVDGQLPVTASPLFRQGQGEIQSEVIRFGFSLPEEKGLRSRTLQGIDSIANYYIRLHAIPGCAIAVMRGDKIIYEGNFGKFDYNASSDSVDALHTMYDIASMTKIVATVTTIMQLYEQGLINLDASITSYLPDFQYTNKGSVTVREILQHTAGLKAWIPFYLETFADANKMQPSDFIYAKTQSNEYPIEVVPGMFMRKDYQTTMWDKIKNSEMGVRGRMVYSDLGLITLGKIIEKVTGQTLDEYTCGNFFQPMGMSSTMFNPGQKGNGMWCAPTELDDSWRHCVVQGYVHDYASAMLGGVAGHAGLFSNVYDLCKYSLMIKNGGYYGKRGYISSPTIKYFTQKQSGASRRGLGWDKPNSDPDKADPSSAYASDETYGHTGFTGTCFWIDPKYDLVYIFLGNRTYPNFKYNKMFNKQRVRQVIMDKIYEAMRGVS